MFLSLTYFLFVRICLSPCFCHPDLQFHVGRLYQHTENPHPSSPTFTVRLTDRLTHTEEEGDEDGIYCYLCALFCCDPHVNSGLLPSFYSHLIVLLVKASRSVTETECGPEPGIRSQRSLGFHTTAELKQPQKTNLPSVLLTRFLSGTAKSKYVVFCPVRFIFSCYYSTFLHFSEQLIPQKESGPSKDSNRRKEAVDSR